MFSGGNAVEEAIKPQRRDNLVRFSCRVYRSMFVLILCVTPNVLRASDGHLYPPPEEEEGTMVKGGSNGGMYELINGQVSSQQTLIREGRHYSRTLMSNLPGSTPAKCSSKCNGCNPCEAVQVRIEPPQDTDSEYYPEAWRCKCGGRLYMP